jgi:hypothetical protein
MRRTAEMEGRWWHTEVEMPLLESGMGEAEMTEASHRLSSELTAMQETALLEIYHAHHEDAATKNMVEDIESALARAGVHSRVERTPAICFLDVTGYTRLTEERGDEAAAGLAERLSRMVQRASVTTEASRSSGWATASCSISRSPGRGWWRHSTGRRRYRRRASAGPCGSPRGRFSSRRGTISGKR